MIDDRFVRKVLSPILLLIFVCFMLPALAAAWILIRTELLLAKETNDTLMILGWLQGFDNLPADSAGLIIGALPMLIAALAYRSDKEQHLSITGRFALLITLLGTIVSAAVVALVNPEDPSQANAISRGRDSLLILEESGTTSMRLMLTYLLLLIGQQIPVKDSGS